MNTTSLEKKEATHLLEASKESHALNLPQWSSCGFKHRISFRRSLYETLWWHQLDLCGTRAFRPSHVQQLCLACFLTRWQRLATPNSWIRVHWRSRSSRQNYLFVRVPAEENLSRTWLMSRTVLCFVPLERSQWFYLCTASILLFLFALRPHKPHSVCQCSYHE